MILHPNLDDITFPDLNVLVMKYYWAYVKHSQTPEPPRGHAMAVQDLGDAFDMALVAPGQPLLQCPFCRDEVSYHRFRACPVFVETIKAGLAYRTGMLDHRWNPEKQEFADAAMKGASAKSVQPPAKQGRRRGPGAGQASQTQHKAAVAQYAMVAQGNANGKGVQHHPPPDTQIPTYRPPPNQNRTGHKTYCDHFDDREQGNVLVALQQAQCGVAYEVGPPQLQTDSEFMQQMRFEFGTATQEKILAVPEAGKLPIAGAPSCNPVPVRVTPANGYVPKLMDAWDECSNVQRPRDD